MRAPAYEEFAMTQHLISETTPDSWENEGGSLPSSYPEFASVPRFLTALYVVDGHAYASLVDAVAQEPRLFGRARP
jgi:hypothetical protein